MIHISCRSKEQTPKQAFQSVQEQVFSVGESDSIWRGLSGISDKIKHGNNGRGCDNAPVKKEANDAIKYKSTFEQRVIFTLL